MPTLMGPVPTTSPGQLLSAIWNMICVYCRAHGVPMPTLMGPVPTTSPGQPVPDFTFLYGLDLLTFNQAAINAFDLQSALDFPMDPATFVIGVAIMGIPARESKRTCQSPARLMLENVKKETKRSRARRCGFSLRLARVVCLFCLLCLCLVRVVGS